MTTYTHSVSLQTSTVSQTVTQNVTTADTVILNMSAYFGAVYFSKSGPVSYSLQSSGSSVATMTFTGTGSYAITFRAYYPPGGGWRYVALSGTSSSSSDTTPNAFTFTDRTGDVSTEQNSAVQITGINAATAVSRTSGGATFAVSSLSSTPGAQGFGTSATTITNNQYLHVKQTTSSTYSAVLNTVMNVGGVTDTWTVTSNAAAADGTPDPYSFNDVTAALNTVSYSYAQITGISQTVTASRSSGTATFAISGSTTVPNSSGFSSANKNVSNNQYLHVKQTSSGSNSTTLSSVFAVGGVSATWNLTTVAASGGSGNYGMQIMPPTGSIPRLDTSDRTLRVFATFTGSLGSASSSSTSSTHTLSGFNPSDATIGLDWETSANREFVTLTTSTNTLTLTRANDPSPNTAEYQLKVFRI